jgi:hypothetical protein
MRRAAIISLLALALPGPAYAQDDDLPRWQYGFGYAGGAEQIGGLGFINMGIRLHLARAVTPEVRVAANADLLATYRGTGEEMVMGETLRATLGAEWEAGHFGDRHFFSGGISVVGGGGTELITWERGMVARPLLYLGVESFTRLRVPRDGRVLRGARSIGQLFGVRALVARGIAPDKVPMHRTDPSPAANLELGFLAYLTLDFGR